MRYPKEVFSVREDLTRNTMREYEIKVSVFYWKCLEINPNYYNLGLKDRIAVRKKAEEILGFRI